MKQLKQIAWLLLSLWMVACDKEQTSPNPNPNEEPVTELTANTYRIDQTVRAFGSVALAMLDDNPSVVATPTVGVDGMEAILKAEEFLFVGINPLLNGEEFDLKEETLLFTVISSLAGAELAGVSPENSGEIRSGSCRFDYDKTTQRLTLRAEMVLESGVELALWIEAEGALTVNENRYICGQEQEPKPIRASFYKQVANRASTILYFTPANISYFEELDLTWSYLYVELADALLTGASFDITTLTAEQCFRLGYEDHVTPRQSWMVTPADLQGATGQIAIRELAEGCYSATIEVLFAGISYAVYFEGACRSDREQQPEESNENGFTIGGETLGVDKARMTQEDSVARIELTLSNAKQVVVTLPTAFMDGNPRGFSQSADLTLTYEGVTFSKANGYSGTLTVKWESGSESIEMEFTNYAGCELYYKGAVEVAE